ncbi:aromatic ring-hydroxylating oxygenase subunit alpha [Nitrospirillum iridis]|uniref:Phenylpropionate dioxygenase-like ring-hydroxylating dioxygenase large terminal subunit n=1 Tax=Nitrospirillum iridis TaxID=765888 RepID=A0A7X0AY93_9PROT|nr:SRPBCC family protein [Nitrospirillum iridis]MBB6252230.1 phenylpropionate dioxygenase-like ring-hydroxylating dioxygenase large terminal subunit [Nitrospirillum iridis]
MTDRIAEMRAALAPQDYGAATAGAETRALFARLWHFVGFSDELAAPDGYLVRTIAGVPVVVQRFDDDIRAFRDICSHRHARLHRTDSGRGALRCPYHGWTYNREGVPVGVPGNDTCFHLDKADKAALALTGYEVARRGRFVFVRLMPGGPALDDWLGPLGAWLDAVSDGFAAPFDQAPLDWRADWKVGMENVLEVYHVDAVHPETFRTVTEGAWVCAEHGPHSTGTIGLTAETRRWWDGVAKRLKLTPLTNFTDYDHAILFPNLAIGLTAGLMASVQTYEPVYAPDGAVLPGRCTLRYRLSLAKPQPGGSAAARAGVEGHLAEFNRRLLAEDQTVAEAAWAGTMQAQHPALLGDNEGRIRAFHTVWRQAMGYEA